MKVLLIIPVHDRPDYLSLCLISVKNADLTDTTVLLIDDCSKNKTALDYFHDFYIPGVPVIKIRNDENLKVYGSLRKALQGQDFDLYINLDSDAIVKPDFIQKIISTRDKAPGCIVSGFNCMTLNKDGSERHPIISMNDSVVLKKSIGGINMAYDQKQLEEIVLPVLNRCCESGGNWDHMVSIKSMELGFPMACVRPSVVQHIGVKSSMGHHEQPDTAQDFEEVSKLKLDNVTLFILDTKNPEGLIHAVQQSTKEIQFKEIIAITGEEHLETLNRAGIPATAMNIDSKEEYSDFMIKRLADHINTDYVLVIQADGFVLNPSAWSAAFLRYDYIGAPWWFNDGKNVGNGGFSLRSKKLLKELQASGIKIVHPEDESIGRTYRKVLEERGIVYAPENIANQFSIEAYGKRDNRYRGSFGYHGFGVDFSRSPEIKKVVPENPIKGPKTYIFNQFRGLGDILFIMKIAQDEIKKGNKVIIPVEPQYMDIAKHFPMIEFVRKNRLNINYDRREPFIHRGCEVIPFRWANDIMGVPYTDCMKAKYWYWKQDWEQWRDFEIVRDARAESKLLTMHRITGEFNFINKSFRTNFSGKSPIQVSNGLRNIDMKAMPGFSLIDWSVMLERAANIHTVGTSINYLIEKLDIKAPIHLYKRLPEETHFDNYRYILDEEKKNYIFH